MDLSGIAPDGVPVATDGFGNHWVVDVRDGRPAEVLFIAHDPPVVVLQARSVGDFLVQWFETGLDPDGDSPLDAVHEAANQVWRRPPDQWDAREATPARGSRGRARTRPSGGEQLDGQSIERISQRGAEGRHRGGRGQ
ncbi:hypothetical protein GCM10017567_06390 [Amycolatopsis bullii]|uniref:Knr4/Smi1-like domain-containing protein n=1 Tax=Amycolatopsis bullii TaxID=941987 RepID=A0ABQ3K087_9PSEU|nr:hypothetical protein GCM10017567_06390 [Amycolatopsis bullii]